MDKVMALLSIYEEEEEIQQELEMVTHNENVYLKISSRLSVVHTGKKVQRKAQEIKIGLQEN